MAINANTVWEFRTSGSNDNSGGFKAGGTGTDYSQQDAAQLTLSDLATDGAGTGLSSATGGFTAAMVDNIIYIKSGTGFTVGWYEITAYTDTNNVTIDRSAGASATSGAGSVGGARALPTDAWIEMTVDGNHSHFKSGTYTFTETVSNSDAGSSSLSHVYEGYLATRGDAPTGDDRPLFATGAYSFWINGTAWMYNIRVTTTSLRALYNNLASNVSYVNCSGINTSGTASRYGIDAFGTNAKVYHCEGVSANGIALRVSTDAIVVKSEFRDSVTGGSLDGNYNRFCSNIFDTISGTAIDVATRQGSLASNNTFYNVATGISITTGSRNDIINNIFHTCTTVGVVCNSDKKTVNNLYGNMWYHNTADTTNAIKSGSAIDADPEFVNAAAGDFTAGSNAEVLATTPSGRTSLTTTKGAIPAAGGGGGVFHFSNRFNTIGGANNMIVKKDAQWIAPVLLYDATDGKTAETGIAYSAVTVKYSRNGGAWATLTMSSGNWTEVGDGHYVVTFPAVGAIDTLGTFQFIVSDNLSTFLDYNGAATIVSGTNTELETKIDTIKDTDLPAVKVDTAAILVDTGTTLPTSIAAIPTATEIDTELTTVHGSGAWTDSAGTGVNTVVIHTKDGSSVDIEGVKISIHNSSNDDSPLIATGTTDADGNATVSLDSATYYVRGYKAGYSFAATSITILGSSTEELTGTSVTISAPADPDLCRLYFYPKTLGNAAISDLLVYISSNVAFAKLDDILISNQTKKFTYDSGDDKYYFDALQGASVKIECPELWSGVKSVVTPSESTYSLYDLI